MGLFKQKYVLGAATVALAIPAMAVSAVADQQLDAVLQRLERLEKENAKLKGQIKDIEAKTSKPVQVKVVPVKGDPKAPANAGNSGFVQVSFPKGVYGGTATLAEPVAYSGGKDGGGEDDWWIHHKPGSKLTFQTPNGEITAYGRLNMTIQDTTPGWAGFNCRPDVCNPANNPGATFPIGNGGWMPSIGSSNSYVGIRGYQNLGDWPMRFVYQLETSIDLEAQPGVGETNSKLNNNVAGALVSRNSYVGFAGDWWGSVKAGKTTTPYANSTQVMNPFAGMLGNYNVIMSNTGGDNRAEFNSRLDHSIWYESPNFNVAGGKFSLAALYSPGQNRADNSDNIPAGESECTGGNSPVSGGFSTCSDGSFSDAFSVSATYQTSISLGGGGFKDVPNEIGVLITGGYERHMKVNRSSDMLAEYGVPPVDGVFLTPAGFAVPGAFKNNGAAALALYNQDIADEDAMKVGVQFKLPTNTTVSAIYEHMNRYLSADLQFQNERQGDRTWLAISQDINEKHNVAFGWGHAFRAPGDPCQHSDCFLTHTDADGNQSVFAPNHNAANMFTAAWSYKFYPGWTWFADYAITINEGSAHFDLAQGGGAATTDCHDASSAIGGVGAILPAPGNTNPHCWTGGILQGIQTGVRWNF